MKVKPYGDAHHHSVTGWWQLKYVFMFTPNLGEDEPILTHIFQRGLVRLTNHQWKSGFVWFTWRFGGWVWFSTGVLSKVPGVSSSARQRKWR